MAKKPKQAINKNGIVYVKYLDAVLFTSGNAKEQAPTIREAYGRIVNQTETYITLVFDYSPNLPNKDTGLSIPRGCVLEIREVG